MKVTIVPMSEETLDEQAILLAEYQEFYHSTPNYQHNLLFLQNFLNGNNGKFFIAKEGAHFVGYVALYFSYSSITAQPIAILNDLFVRKAYRNQGIGKQLIDFAINHVSSMGIEQVRWFTRTSNKSAQKLYKKYNSIETDWLHFDLKLEDETANQ